MQLKAGDRLVLVTDGVLEAGAPGPEFGEDRLSGLLLATAPLTPHQCVAEILHTVRSYAPRMHDDATVVCLDWRGRDACLLALTRPRSAHRRQWRQDVSLPPGDAAPRAGREGGC